MKRMIMIIAVIIGMLISAPASAQLFGKEKKSKEKSIYNKSGLIGKRKTNNRNAYVNPLYACNSKASKASKKVARKRSKRSKRRRNK